MENNRSYASKLKVYLMQHLSIEQMKVINMSACIELVILSFFVIPSSARNLTFSSMVDTVPSRKKKRIDTENRWRFGLASVIIILLVTIFSRDERPDAYYFAEQVGMASGLETLCGQAYGAKHFDNLGLQTYRAMVTLIIVSIPISLLWAFIGKLLILIGQDPLISKEAGRYIVWLIPGLFAYAISQPLTKFLQSQSLIIPMLWSSIASLLLHIPLCWLLVFKTSLEFLGASLAISLSYWLNVIMLAAYIGYSNSCKETRSLPTIEAFRGIGLFLRLALPSALMLW